MVKACSGISVTAQSQSLWGLCLATERDSWAHSHLQLGKSSLGLKAFWQRKSLLLEISANHKIPNEDPICSLRFSLCKGLNVLPALEQNTTWKGDLQVSLQFGVFFSVCCRKDKIRLLVATKRYLWWLQKTCGTSKDSYSLSKESDFTS